MIPIKINLYTYGMKVLIIAECSGKQTPSINGNLVTSTKLQIEVAPNLVTHAKLESRIAIQLSYSAMTFCCEKFGPCRNGANTLSCSNRPRKNRIKTI